MKQLGNLAVVCAQRRDVVMTTQDGKVFVLPRVAGSPMIALWDDDEAVSHIIHELNFGACAVERSA